jgi:uncharacterized protein (TIRG00374 family)
LKPQGKPPRGWQGRTLIIWTAVGGAVVFALLSLISDLDVLIEALKNFPLKLLIPIGLLSLGNYALRFIKWHWYLIKIGQPIPVGANSLIFLSGFALTVTPGKVGEFIKAFILKVKHGVPYTSSTAVLLMERFTDVIAIVLLCFLGLFLEFLSPIWVVISVTIIVAIIALGRNRRFVGYLIDHFNHVPLLKGLTKHLHQLYDSGWVLTSPGIYTWSLVISVIAWFMEGLGFYLVVQGLGFNLPITEAVFIYSASLIGGVLTLFLGGLGATEGALVGLGIAFGMTRDISIAAAIIIRVMTLWLAVVIGWMVFLLTPGLRSLLKASSMEKEVKTYELI